jgi:hypothetical protein
VEVVAGFIREEYSKAGLNILAQTARHEALTLEDVDPILTRIETNVRGAVGKETICAVLQYFVFHGRATRDELKAKFSLAENNQLRPLLAALTSERLIKSSRGFYPEPKLIQAYKVSEGFRFNKVNKINNLRKEPQKNSVLEEKINLFYSDFVKVVNLVKIEFTAGTQQECEELLVKHGLSHEEAEKLFNRLVDDGMLGLDSDGFWRWVEVENDYMSEWEGFHAVGPMATPEKGFRKTVDALLEYVEIEKTSVISDASLTRLFDYYWTRESHERVTRRLLERGYLKPFGSGKFLIVENPEVK